jgi:hypothetical protein
MTFYSTFNDFDQSDDFYENDFDDGQADYEDAEDIDDMYANDYGEDDFGEDDFGEEDFDEDDEEDFDEDDYEDDYAAPSGAPPKKKVAKSTKPAPKRRPVMASGVVPKAFKGCARPPTCVRVPRIKYVLHKKPVVYESVTKHVSYDKIPISQFYSTKNYPTRVVKACGCPVKKRCGCRA